MVIYKEGLSRTEGWGTNIRLLENKKTARTGTTTIAEMFSRLRA